MISQRDREVGVGNLVVSNLDASVIEGLRQQAEQAGRSMEAQAREILRAAVSGPSDFDARAKRMRAITAGRKQTPSELLLREHRDR